MRISDWSSDVCSSDLVSKAGVANKRCATLGALRPLNRVPPGTMFTFLDLSPRLLVTTHHSAITGPYHRNGKAVADVMKARSEEHTSELQSLMRISYAVFCLKKKKNE